MSDLDALLHAGEFDDEGETIAEIAARFKWTYAKMAHRLYRLAEKGKLVAGWRTLENGRTVRVFRPVEKRREEQRSCV